MKTAAKHIRPTAVVLCASLLLFVLSACGSPESILRDLASSAPEETSAAPSVSPSEPAVEPTPDPALTDPFNPPEDLTLCPYIDLYDGGAEDNMAWFEAHEGMWVNISGLVVDWSNTDDGMYCYYAPNETGNGSFRVTADMGVSIVLMDGLSDTAYVYLARSGSAITGNNAFIENMDSITSDPTGPNGEPPEDSTDGPTPVLTVTADEITANEPRFLSSYEGMYITVTGISIYNIYENYASGTVDVYFSNTEDLFSLNEYIVITVSGTVCQDEIWRDVIIKDAVLVSIDQDSLWSW